MKKEHNSIIRSYIKLIYSKYWYLVDIDTIKSEAYFIYIFLGEKNKLNEHDHHSLKFYLYKRLQSLIRKEAKYWEKRKYLQKQKQIKENFDIIIDPDRELDFRHGINSLSPDAQNIIEMIFDEKSCIKTFNMQGIIQASKKNGIKKTNCLKAIREIKIFLKEL